MLESVTRKYIAPANTNGKGTAVGKMTILPGHTKVPRPTKPDMAADAPMAIVSAVYPNIGMNKARLPRIPEKRYTTRYFHLFTFFSIVQPRKNRAIMLPIKCEKFAWRNIEAMIT